MSQRISLKELEGNLFRSAFQDGLLDIFLGSVILMFAIAPLLSPYLGDFWSSAVFLPFWAILYFILWLIRKYIVKPRIGNVEYGSWRMARMMRFSVVMLFACSTALILGFLSAYRFDAVPGWIHTARFSLLVLIGFSVAAYFLNLSRLYQYGILIALAPLAGELLYEYLNIPHHGYPVTFGFVSALIMIIGLVLLVRLIRTHTLNDYAPFFGEAVE